MNENRYYEEIMKLDECDDMKSILHSWQIFSNNIASLANKAAVVLPDMLWIVKSGYGKTNLLQLVTGYLYEEQLMEFYGDVKFFEYTLEHVPTSTADSLIDDFSLSLSDAAGFRSEFKGVVCVDISRWIDHLDDERFIYFLEYLSENSRYWHIIFSVDCGDKEKLEKLEALLDVYFRIEKVAFRLPKTESLCRFAEENLSKYGFTLEPDAKEILLETIEALRQGKKFDGYKTIEMICSDLIYREISSPDFGGYVITSETVSYYDKNSDFVRRTKNNIEKRRQIGYMS